MPLWHGPFASRKRVQSKILAKGGVPSINRCILGSLSYRMPCRITGGIPEMANVNVDDVVGILSSPKFVDALQRPELQNAIHKLSPPTYEYVTIWILIGTVAVAAVSAILVWLQLRADHERSRRELAVSLINEWSNSLDIETAGVVRLVRELTRDQCDLLSSRKPFKLDKNNLDLVKACLETRFPEINNEPQFDAQSTNTMMININHRYSGYIKFVASRYLNSLESIMIAWYESVAQPRIIEGQFGSMLLRFFAALTAGSSNSKTSSDFGLSFMV